MAKRKPRGPSRIAQDPSKPRCQRCERRAVNFRRFLWLCRLHQGDDTPAPNCSHPSGMHFDGVWTCSWCCGTVFCDWPRPQ